MALMLLSERSLPFPQRTCAVSLHSTSSPCGGPLSAFVSHALTPPPLFCVEMCQAGCCCGLFVKPLCPMLGDLRLGVGLGEGAWGMVVTHSPFEFSMILTPPPSDPHVVPVRGGMKRTKIPSYFWVGLWRKRTCEEPFCNCMCIRDVNLNPKGLNNKGMQNI